MAEQWVMTRLRSTTRQRLDSAKARFLAGAEKGQRAVELDHRNDGPSVDWVIRQLLDLLDKQQAREARVKAKRQKPGITPDLAIA